MWGFIQSNADLLVNIAVLGTFIGSLLMWSHKRLRADMNEFKSGMNEFKSDIKVLNIRLDATNARIDQSYKMILDIMKELKMSKQDS